MLTLSVAVPVLEQDALLFEPVAESEHAPGECPSGHEHTVCTQVGKNLPIEDDVVYSPWTGLPLSVSTNHDTGALSARSDEGSRRSRAPPLA